MLMPTVNPMMVRMSCNLLKLSDRISKVPEGLTPRVKKRSRPVASNSEVDSSNAGDVCSSLTPYTWDD